MYTCRCICIKNTFINSRIFINSMLFISAEIIEIAQPAPYMVNLPALPYFLIILFPLFLILHPSLNLQIIIYLELEKYENQLLYLDIVRFY